MDSDEVWKCDLCNKCFQYKSEVRNHLHGHSDLRRICRLNSNNTNLTTEEPRENMISSYTNVLKQKQHNERESLKINKSRSELSSDDQNGKKLKNEDFEHALKAALGNYKPRISKYFKCRKCHVQFITKIRFDMHILSSHEDIRTDKNLGMVLYKCKMCPYRSIYNNALSKHKSTWHKERIWHNCDICEYRTALKECLTQHILSIHEGVRYICELCDYQGSSVKAIKFHIKVKHEGLRFSCSQCKFKAKHRTTLKLHIESKHSDIKYRCDKCGYEKSSSRCRVNHSGIKYFCDQCDVQFTQQSSLKVHLRIKHEGNIYNCEKCEYKSTTQRGLRLHREKHEEQKTSQ